MAFPKLTKLELQIMEALWSRGACSVREILETFPERNRPAYTTVQTTVYRMEGKKALRCVKRIGNANIFEAAISREQAQGRLVRGCRPAEAPGNLEGPGIADAGVRPHGPRAQPQVPLALGSQPEREVGLGAGE